MKVICLLVAMVSLARPALPAEGGAKDADKYAKQLELFVKGNRSKAINDLIKEMAGADDPKVAVLFPGAGTVIPSSANYAAAVDSIAGLKSEASVQALAAVLKKTKGDYRQRVLILEAFGRRTDPASLDAIMEQLKSPIVHVQVAAIHAARARKERAPIPALIEFLADHQKARNRSWHETHLALIDLTGKDFDSVEDWKKFWSSVESTFDPKQVGKEGGTTRIEAKRVKPTDDSVEFFGSEIFSRNLIFVIDVSGSMFMYDDSSEYKGNDIEQDRQRLRRAREQLTQALKKLPKSALFNIITFSDKVLPWQKRMQQATPANIAAALKFVNEFQAWGATHTDEALEMAFGDLAADTIVLLSDGAPAHKDADSKILIPKIIEHVKDLNSARKVTLHAFGFEGSGTWPKKVPKAGGMKLPPPPSAEEVKTFIEFLKQLASDSGGEFHTIS